MQVNFRFQCFHVESKLFKCFAGSPIRFGVKFISMTRKVKLYSTGLLMMENNSVCQILLF